MAVQPGDVINFARLAWDIYNLGWTKDLQASKQYQEFGRDIFGLANSLEILTDVVSTANASLQRQAGRDAGVQWDPTSLREIVGDYEQTLRECSDLLASNRRYQATRNPLLSIEWNVLVQPRAERLQQRISMHNSKILLLLKPFEIDLLCRVRQDLYRIHTDLANRIGSVHFDLRRLIGVLVPDLQHELDQQARREIRLLDVPTDIAEQFRLVALAERPEYDTDTAFPIEELADAFVLHFNKSTKTFSSGMLVSQREPPLDAYLSLLKCIWVLKRIKASPSHHDASPASHWPSYVRQLEDDLSFECSRFNAELVHPRVSADQLKPKMFAVWPKREQPELLDILTRDAEMEQILEARLQSTTSVERSMKLLRRIGSDGKRFRIVLSGSEQVSLGTPRQRTEVIDFDITSILLNPVYATPLNTSMMNEMILCRDARIAKLSFARAKDILRFQQAMTGFAVWDSWSQTSVVVSFVVKGIAEPIYEKAVLQFWVPSPLDGSRVTNDDIAQDPKISEPFRSGSVSSAATSIPQPAESSRRNTAYGPPSYPLSRSPENIGQSPWHHSTSNSMSSPTQSSARQMSGAWQEPGLPAGLGISPPRTVGVYPRQQNIPNSLSPTTSGRGYAPSMASHRATSTARSGSMSSSVSIALSNSSSSGSDHTTSITTSPGATGNLYRRPPKPMMVLFTQRESTGQMSIVTIAIDSETTVNPERCNCRRAGPDGSSCNTAVIERRNGKSKLEARRYETSTGHDNPSFSGVGRTGDTDWNLARLAIGNPASISDANAWPGVRRLSIMFPHHDDRARFGGTPNLCHCRVRTVAELRNCLGAGHKGYMGEVQEFYRKQANNFHQERYESQKHVVNGLM